jgi:hypothetical protein
MSLRKVSLGLENVEEVEATANRLVGAPLL